MEAKFISDEEKHFWDLLSKLDQKHILEEIPKHSTEERQAFVEQLKKLNATYPGGLETYYSRAKKLLSESLQDINPYEGFTPSPPPTENIEFGSDSFSELEEIGSHELNKTAFVLVAGGLGERLGYEGIKVQIPLDLISEMSFLEYYIRYIEAFQNKHAQGKAIPLAIMTSDDTHNLTVKLLEEHNNFGMPKDQIILMKQEKVPALLDNEAHFAIEDHHFLIETKPHGHGDVHTLLYQYGLPKKWYDEGRRWVIFFQDTNPLVFRSIPSILGVSKKRNFEMNSVVVPRKPGEAVGALCTLKRSDDTSLTINVEYNQLDALFKTVGGEKTDAKGYSVYPGNINFLVFSLEEYMTTLSETKGNISEFINPKYSDQTKTKFKSPTRLECMMQDYPKLLKNSNRVGATQIEKAFSFSACKNDLKTAAEKSKKNLPPECASSCEWDFYYENTAVLRMCGIDVESTSEKKSYAGIEFEVGAKIVLMPEFGVTLKEIKSKSKGKNFISSKSSVVFDGNISLEDVYIDGSVWIKGDKSLSKVSISDKNYIDFEETNKESDPPHIKIRGYKATNHDKIKYL